MIQVKPLAADGQYKRRKGGGEKQLAGGAKLKKGLAKTVT